MLGRTDFHVFDSGSVTAHKYVDTGVDPYIRLFPDAQDIDILVHRR